MPTYAFPPFRLILTTLLKIARSKWGNEFHSSVLAEPTLVFTHPEIPNSSSIQFSKRREPSVQKKGQLVHQDLESLQLTAWKLSTNVSKKREFLRELLTLKSLPEDPLLPKLTIQDRPTVQTGQALTLSIPWRRL